MELNRDSQQRDLKLQLQEMEKQKLSRDIKLRLRQET